MRIFLLFVLGLAAGRLEILAQDPESPPELDAPHAGADVVSGKSTESALPVRVKVFDSNGHLIEQRDILVTGSNVVAGFQSRLRAGQVVQAYFLRGALEIMPSAPLVVANAVERVPARASVPSAAGPAQNAIAVRIRGELLPGATNVYIDATPTIPNSGFETRIYSCPDGVPAGIRDSSGFRPYAITDATGQASITFEQPLAAGQVVSLCQSLVDISDPATPSIQAPGSGPMAIANPLDLGRVRYYFTAGAILSNDQGFQLNPPGAQAALFLDLNSDRAWLPLDSNGFRRANVNTYVDIALTSVPLQQVQTSSTLESFIQSQKAATFQGGAYFPLIAGEPWSTGGSRYSMFVAPIAKTSFTTLASDATAATAVTDRFFKSYSFGARLGIFHHSRSTAAAPELVSYVDIARGRFGDFEAFRGSPVGPHPGLLLERPWRYSVEGLFKVPHSPFVMGFNANVGTGGKAAFTEPRDDLRFLFGAQFDFSRLLKALPQF